MKLGKAAQNMNYRIIIFGLIIFISGLLVFKNSIMDAFNILDRKIPIYSVDTGEDKVVAISFDASWGADNTIKILDILDQENVKSTFFLVGRWVDEYQEEVKEIHKRGHEIGNHSNSHPNMTTLTKDQMKKEILITDAKIRDLTGEGTKTFRCPEGAYNDQVMVAVEETDHYTIQWDVDSIDWKEQGADIEYQRVIDNVKPGSIILFHNNAKYTPENLPRVLQNLKKDGYSFVTVSEIIFKDNFSIDHTGKQYKN